MNQSKKIFLITALINLCLVCCINAQDSSPALINVIPSSPNVAALSKFGNTPVSYFTGLPEISIPLFNIKSGKLHLPVNISYHASGIKVEEIASNVGLGWALSAGGMITRSIRGIGDDEYNGYFNKNLNMKVSDIVSNPASNDAVSTLRDVAKGANDVEADLFYFNMGGVSGKFVYNQADTKFYSIPRQDIKIEYDASVSSPGNFKITLASGDSYYFSDIEKTTTQAICSPATANATTHATAWCLTRIESYDKKDIVTFEYEPNIYNYEALGTETRYLLKRVISGPSGSAPTNLMQNVCSQAISIQELRLKKISFKNGSLIFHSNTSRCDLIGTKRLDDIEMDDLNGNVLKTWKFNFGYFGSYDNIPSGCGDYTQAQFLRLKLKGLQETSLSNGTPVSLPPYTFDYNEINPLPGRNSKAQDYWGYYNGKDNTTMIPSYIVQTPNGPLQYNGADRLADSSFSLSGSLRKITYPTGGSTEYLMQTNEISSTQTQAPSQNNIVALYGDNQGIQTNYEQQFTINYGPNDYNGHNPQGGAYLSFDFGDIGCDISAGASPCALLSLVGLTPNTAGLTINRSGNSIYIPNGDYKLTASFQQNPANFGDFYLRAKWLSPSEQPTDIVNKRYTGGLRIKQIIDHDAVDPAHDIYRSFTYTSPTDSTVSSGLLNGYPNANNFVQNPFIYYYFEDATVGMEARVAVTVMDFAKITSYSNAPAIQTQGSYTSYSYVTEVLGRSQDSGKSTYAYTNVPDEIDATMPYAVTSNDYRRGLLLEKNDYRSLGSKQYAIVKKVHNDYISKSSPAIKNSGSLKTYFDTAFGGDGVVDAGSLAYVEGLDIPLYSKYTDTCSWVGLARSIEKYYDSADTNKSTSLIKDFGYSGNHYLVSRQKTTTSKGDSIITITTYPPDYIFNTAPGSNNAAAIKYLLDNNILDKPVETRSFYGSSIGSRSTSGKFNAYHPGNAQIDSVLFAKIPPNTNVLMTPSYFNNGDIIKSNVYEPRIQMRYNNHNKIIEEKLVNGPPVVYLWGYHNEYPIAQIQKADYAAVSSALASNGIDPENLADQGTFSNADMATIRSVLALFLPDAQITTYLYAPLVGMTSMTDPKGMTTSYEYDAMQRLITIKDNHGNIIKHIDYHYQGQ